MGLLDVLGALMPEGINTEHKTPSELRGWQKLADTSAGANPKLEPEAAKGEMDRDVYAKTAKAEDPSAPLEVMQTIKERMKGKTLPEEAVFGAYHSWRTPPKWSAPGDLKQLAGIKDKADQFMAGTAKPDLPEGTKFFHKVGTPAPGWFDIAKAVQRGKHWFY